MTPNRRVTWQAHWTTKILSDAWRRGRRLAARGARSRTSGCGVIGVLIQVAEGDPQARIEVAAFLRSLQELGWSEGRIMTQQLILKRASAGERGWEQS